MRKIHLPFSTIRSRIIAFFLISSFIPFMILGGVSWYHYQSTIKDNAFSYTQQVMTLTAAGLEDYLNQLDQYYYAVYSQGLPRLLSDMEAEPAKSAKAYISLNETAIRLQTFYNLSHTMPYLSIASESGEIVYQSSRALANDYDFSQSDWFKTLANSNAHSSLSPARRLPYHETDTRDSGKKYITYAQKVTNYNTTESNYIFLMDFDTAVIDELLSTLIQGSTGSLFLINGDELIYSINPDRFRPEEVIHFQEECRHQGGSYQETIDRIPYFISSYPVSQASLRILCVNSIPDLTANVPDLKHFTLFLITVSMLITLCLACFFSARLVKPIHDLKEVTYEVMRGNLDITVPPLTHDEIGDLGICLDQMLSHIRSLIREKYEYSLREKELQIHTLQSQINPHFLYNTLETISSIAENEGVDTVRDIAFSMAELYRYSISASDRLVPIRAELEHIRNYLDIIHVRFGDRIQIHYDLEEDALDCLILKLTLQPLVENAIYHGLEPKRGIGNLTVSVCSVGFTGGAGNGAVDIDTNDSIDGSVNSFVEITIRDDGIGMDAEKLHSLLLQLEGSGPDSIPQDKKGHIGISNVNRRLRLRFGDSCGIRIDSRPGEGTCVQIRLAAQ